MDTATIQAIEARQNLGELLEKVFYQNKQFTIARKDKPMARLVGEPFMAAIEQLIVQDPGLADTLAIMLNQEASEAIEQSRQEYQEGKKIPIENLLSK